MLFSVTKLGDKSIESIPFVRRYLPLTIGWTLVYLSLALTLIPHICGDKATSTNPRVVTRAHKQTSTYYCRTTTGRA